MRFLLYWALVYCTLPVAMARPIVGLFVYTAVNVFRPEMLFWGDQSMGGRSLFMIYLATLLGVVFTGLFDMRAATRWTQLVMYAIYIVVALSIFAGAYQDPRLLQWTYCTEILKAGILCYVILATLNSPERLRSYLSLNMITAGGLALWGVDQYFRGNERLEGLGGKAISDSNYAAAFFVLFLPLVLSRALDAKGWKDRLIYFGCSVAVFAVIPCTQSRGGFMGAAVALVAFAVTTRHRRKFLLYGGIILLIASPILTAGVFDRFTETAQGGEVEELDKSAQSRLVMWRAAWYCFADNPVLGVGYKCFPRYKKRYVDQVVDDFNGQIPDDIVEWMMLHPKVTHSLFFQILSEGGLMLVIPVLGLYFGSVWVNHRAARRARKRTDALGIELRSRLYAVNAGLMGWLVCMIFLDGLVGFFSYIVVALGTALRGHLEDSGKALADAPHEEAPPVMPRRSVAAAALARSPARTPAS